MSRSASAISGARLRIYATAPNYKLAAHSELRRQARFVLEWQHTNDYGGTPCLGKGVPETHTVKYELLQTSEREQAKRRLDDTLAQERERERERAKEWAKEQAQERAQERGP